MVFRLMVKDVWSGLKFACSTGLEIRRLFKLPRQRAKPGQDLTHFAPLEPPPLQRCVLLPSEMSLPRTFFRPRFTPIPSDVDIPALVDTTPNFHWAHREDARLHSAPFTRLSHIIHVVTIEQ